MKKLSFFDDNESYTNDAIEMEKEVRHCIQDLFVKWSEKGFKMREIQIVLINLISELTSFSVIRNRRALKTSK
jgi:hypothetical protein